ncbi:hypothetical protein WKT04_02735 [Oscillospiraceae bacterium HCN-4035]
MLGRSEFALRQGFAAQNACTAQKRRFFDSSGQRGEQGASEARKRPSGAFVARCACRGVITSRASLVARSKKEVTTYVVTSFLDSGRKLKCSGEVNSPSAKVLLRKTLVRRKSADFLDSGRKLKCSGEVNSPSAKVLLRKTLVRRKSADFLDSGRKLKCSGEVNSPSVRALLRKKRRASFALFLQNDLKAMENIAIIQLKNKNAAAYGCANTHMPAQVSLPPTQ